MALSEKNLRRVRDYAIAEPGFTISFAAWDLSRTGEKISVHPVRQAVKILLEKGVIELIEDGGHEGKVYAYVEPPSVTVLRDPGERRFRELDESRVGELAPSRGVPVAHTGVPVGQSGRPGRDRQRQLQGFNVKRKRNGT